MRMRERTCRVTVVNNYFFNFPVHLTQSYINMGRVEDDGVVIQVSGKSFILFVFKYCNDPCLQPSAETAECYSSANILLFCPRLRPR